MTLSRIINFLKRYALKHPLYVIVYVATYFLPGFSCKASIYTEEDIQHNLKEGKSIIRFGDGEINLLLDLRNHYHVFSKKLKSMMKEIVTSYGSDSPYILAMPKFINYRNDELKAIGKFNVWLPIKVVFTLMFPKTVPYMDAHSFYYDGYFERVVAPYLSDTTIVCVTKQETIESLNTRKLPWGKMLYVKTPEENALSVYGAIKNNLDIALQSLSQENCVILFACGPVGKYMIFEYSQQGYQCIDVGVAIETMFTDISLESRI